MNAPHDLPADHGLTVPPHSNEAEQSVIGALLLNNDAFDTVTTLRADHFYRYEHRIIFDSIARLIVSNRPADVMTVYEHLSTAGRVDQTGGLQYLNAIVGSTPGASNIRRYAEIVIERAQLRGILSAVDEIGAMVHNRAGRTAAEIIMMAQAKFEPLAGAVSTDPKMIGHFLTPIVERIDQQFHGANARADAVPTGITDLDAKLGGGMRGGQLIIIAGRPGMGKTAIALGVAEAVADIGKMSAVFSQEMVGDELCSRALSRASGLPLEKILDGRKFSKQDDHPDWPMLTKGVQRVSDLNIIVDDRPALSLNEIRSQARLIKRRHGLGLIVVDYLGLMAVSEGNNRNEQVGANSRGLKALAKELDVPVVLLAQLNRGVESRADRRPLPSDLRDSGEIEQDADVILFLYRDEVYNPDSPDKGTAEINVAKQRNGPTGIVRAAYFGERTLFADLAPGYAPPPVKSPEKTRRGGFA